MKALIPFKIECGQQACAVEPGKLCTFLTYGPKGVSTCFFFGPLQEKDGWIQRHEMCLGYAKTADNEFWKPVLEGAQCVGE